MVPPLFRIALFSALFTSFASAKGVRQGTSIIGLQGSIVSLPTSPNPMHRRQFSYECNELSCPSPFICNNGLCTAPPIETQLDFSGVGGGGTIQDTNPCTTDGYLLCQRIEMCCAPEEYCVPADEEAGRKTDQCVSCAENTFLCNDGKTCCPNGTLCSEGKCFKPDVVASFTEASASTATGNVAVPTGADGIAATKKDGAGNIVDDLGNIVKEDKSSKGSQDKSPKKEEKSSAFSAFEVPIWKLVSVLGGVALLNM